MEGHKLYLDVTQVENRQGEYVFGRMDSMPNPAVVAKISDYKKHVSQSLISVYPNKLDEIRTANEVAVSIKYDGMFVGYYYNEEESDYKSAFCNSPHHRMIAGLPINAELEKRMKEHKIHSILIVGELLASSRNPPDFEEKCRVTELNHYIRGKNPDDLNNIGFRAFDILEINNQSVSNEIFENRCKYLEEIFKTSGSVGRAVYETINRSQLPRYYQKYVEEKHHEGLVVRTGGIGFKIKPVHTLDVAIIGALNGRFESKISSTQLARALVALRYPNGDYQLIGSVGGGLSDEKRTQLWSKLTFTQDPKFIIPSRDGRMFRMVKPKLVAEILYMDIISDHRGVPIKTPSIKYNESTMEWEMVRPLPFVRLISARFSEQMLRRDKTTDIKDVRVQQILDLVELPMDLKHDPIEYPKSSIITRKVYQKVMKGNTLVRKLLLWETNKNPEEYPSYVLYYLDYSPNRKDPIKRQIKFTHSESQAKELFSDLELREVKKGWKLISDKSSN